VTFVGARKVVERTHHKHDVKRIASHRECTSIGYHRSKSRATGGLCVLGYGVDHRAAMTVIGEPR
jgi:hypothetical protein